MDVSQFEAQLAEQGYQTLTTVSQPAHYHMGDHAHAFDACALITRGDFTLTVQGVATRYAVGDIFRLPAGTVHSERAGAEGVEYRAGRRSKE
jgi:quercetin dioxygenase-like cupin family protein